MTVKQLKMWSRETVRRNRIEPAETENLSNSQKCLITLHRVGWVIKYTVANFRRCPIRRNVIFSRALECYFMHLLSSVYTITYWLSVRLPYGDILHSLTYVGICLSSLAHRFQFVFSSSQYGGIRCCSHSTSKIFLHALTFSTYADEWIIRRGFVHRMQSERYVRSQYGNGSVSIR